MSGTIDFGDTPKPEMLKVSCTTSTRDTGQTMDMIESMGGVVTAAMDLNNAISKGFALDAEGAQHLLTFVKGMQAAVRELLRDEGELSQEPKLGSTPAANVYKPYLPTIATDPDQGLIPVMKRAQQQLDQAATNIQACLTNYEQNEQNVAGGLVSIHPVETA